MTTAVKVTFQPKNDYFVSTMTVTRKPKKPESIIPQAKLLKLFQIMAVLKTDRWTIRNLSGRFETSERTIYRYIKLLEEVDIPIEKGFDNKYFIHSSADEPGKSVFSIEEMKLIKRLIQSEVDNNPLRGLLLKKLSLNSELDNIPRIIAKTRLGKLVEQIGTAIRNKHQVILKNYHSANSNEIKDRLIEPIEFGDNYQSIIALDTKDKECKQFKLDRIGDVVELEKPFSFENRHKKTPSDIFGMTGAKTIWVTLKLKMRAHLLMREEYPLSVPFFEKIDDLNYQFHGPVSNYKGIARFVLGLLDEIEIVQPEAFKEYVGEKIKKRTIGDVQD